MRGENERVGRHLDAASWGSDLRRVRAVEVDHALDSFDVTAGVGEGDWERMETDAE